jgi:hypothetical protein
MNWISVKDGLPLENTVCLVWNETRPFDFYVLIFNVHFSEFEVSEIGCMIRLPNSICFHATHWMKFEMPTIGLEKELLDEE